MNATATAEIYQRPKLQHLRPGSAAVEEVVELARFRYPADTHGHMHPSATAFLLSLADAGGNSETIWQYARILTDFLGVLANANSGRGLDWKNLDDEFLERWKLHLTQQRGVLIGTFNQRLAIVLRWLVYAETKGWVTGLIGDTQSNRPTRVKIFWDGSSIRHYLGDGGAHQAQVDLVSHDDLKLVDAEIDRAASKHFTRRQRRLLNKVLRCAALRRSEGLRLTQHNIPSRRRLEQLRELVGCGKAQPLVSFKIMGSKRGGPRRCEIYLSLAIEIRDFIDGPRSKMLAAKGLSGNSVAEVFVSQKTCKPFIPQSVTNFWKAAAHAAAKRWGRPELAYIRPHHSRHRGITDFARTCLDGGMSPAETMIKVLDFAGLKRLSTASIYLHLAEAEVDSDRPAMRTTLQDRDAEMQKLLMLERFY